jgi:hypothetical protein
VVEVDVVVETVELDETGFSQYTPVKPSRQVHSRSSPLELSSPDAVEQKPPFKHGQNASVEEVVVTEIVPVVVTIVDCRVSQRSPM